MVLSKRLISQPIHKELLKFLPPLLVLCSNTVRHRLRHNSASFAYQFIGLTEISPLS